VKFCFALLKVNVMVARIPGGFLPRQPPLVEESPLYQTSPNPNEVLTSMSPQLISITTSMPMEADAPTSEAAAAPSTTKDVPLASHIRVASGAKACIAPDGREVKHGDLLAPPGPCEICRCDHGTVLCHEEVECMKLIKGESQIKFRASICSFLSALNEKNVPKILIFYLLS